MSDEIVENKNDNAVTEEKKDTTKQPQNITLETINNDIAAMKKEFYEALQRKDNEIATLKDNNSKLEKTVNDQNSLIGNFRETVFNNAKIPPENAVNPDEAYLKQCYEGAYRTAYHWAKNRLIGKNNDENLFMSRCMEAHNGSKL